MITIHIKPKAISISPILPFELSDIMSVVVKNEKLRVVDENFKKIEGWVNVKRNYGTI